MAYSKWVWWIILNLIPISFIMKKILFYFSSDIIKNYKYEIIKPSLSFIFQVLTLYHIKGTTTIKDLSTKIIEGLKVYSTYLL